MSVLFHDTIDENITPVGDDSRKLKDYALRLHDARDKIEALEERINRMEEKAQRDQMQIEKLTEARDDWKREADGLRKQVFETVRLKKVPKG